MARVNDIISTLIGRPFVLAWLSSPGTALAAVMIADIWQWTPLMFLILLAGLVGVPEDQMRAATLLGASWWQRFYTIALPKMKTIMIIALSIRIIENFKIFDTLFIMTGGGPGVATETISVYIYKVTQQDLIWGLRCGDRAGHSRGSVHRRIACHQSHECREGGLSHDCDPPSKSGETLWRFHRAEDHGPRNPRWANSWRCWGHPAAANRQP